MSGFLLSYLTYLLFAAYAREFMARPVLAPVNVAW
ncbi:DUF485 domain-containing protein [Nocardiopsis sp. CNR-923]|nr:DUF485 domain-containing protein [Nocardiopsis sp. CNR-923]